MGTFLRREGAEVSEAGFHGGDVGEEVLRFGEVGDVQLHNLAELLGGGSLGFSKGVFVLGSFPIFVKANPR